METEIFRSTNVLVTDARLVIKGHTYSLAHVTSVRADHSGQSLLGAVRLAVLLSVACVAASVGATALGSSNLGMGELVVSAAFGCASGGVLGVAHWAWTRKSTIIVVTSSGESHGMSSRNRHGIDALVGKLNEAIARNALRAR